MPSAQGGAGIPSGRRTEGTERKPEDGAKRNTEEHNQGDCVRELRRNMYHRVSQRVAARQSGSE